MDDADAAGVGGVSTFNSNALEQCNNAPPGPFTYKRNELLDLKTKQNSRVDEKAFPMSCPKQISLDCEIIAKRNFNRCVYSRTQMLELKDLEKYQSDHYKKTTFLIHRFIPKLYKLDYEISQKQSNGDNPALLLGPQKGSWTIGCHVSKPKRTSNETPVCSNNTKTVVTKPGARKFDRFARRPPGKSMASLTRGKLKFDSGFADTDSINNRKSEPQWYSDGPASINDTIELGGNIDEELDPSKSDGNSIQKKSVKILNNMDETGKLNNISNDLLAPKIENLSAGTSQSSAVKFIDLFAKQNTECIDPIVKPTTEVCGSRFRHLFAKSQSNSPTDASNHATSKLLKLLSSVKSSSVPSQSNTKAEGFSSVSSEPYSASDLETALRSLLLVNKTETTDMTSKNSAGRPLTVQEIEAAEWHRTPSDRNVSIKAIPAIPQCCPGDIHTMESSHRLPSTFGPSTVFIPISQSFEQYAPQKVSASGSLLNRDSLLQSSFPEYSEPFKFNSSAGLMTSANFPTQQNSVNIFFEKMNKDNAAFSSFYSAPRCLPTDRSVINTCSDLPIVDTEVQSLRRPIVKSLQSTNEVLAPPSNLTARQSVHDFGQYNSISTSVELPTLSVSQQNFRDLQSIIQWNRKFNQQQSDPPPTSTIATSSVFEPLHFPFNAGDHPSAFSFPPSLLRSGSSTTNVLPSGQCATIMPESLLPKPVSAFMKPNSSQSTNLFSLEKLWQNQ